MPTRGLHSGHACRGVVREKELGSDLEMEGCVCLWKEGVGGMLDIEILEGFASDW